MDRETGKGGVVSIVSARRSVAAGGGAETFVNAGTDGKMEKFQK